MHNHLPLSATVLRVLMPVQRADGRCGHSFENDGFASPEGGPQDFTGGPRVRLLMDGVVCAPAMVWPGVRGLSFASCRRRA
jgi:hypothetical protein